MDATGYPTRQVERGALQALVRTGRFAHAQEFFAMLSTEFERNFRKEYWLIGAARAFETADPRLTPQLDAWIAHSPRSAPAYTARAAHRMATAWAQRGSRYTRDTSTGQMIGFEDTMALSSEDAQRALKLNPRFLPAYAFLARVAGAVSRAAPPMASIVDRASEECPLCVSVRATAMWFELPVWGGSPERAQALADAGMRGLAKNARLSVLAGYVSDVRCDMAERAKQQALPRSHGRLAARTKCGPRSWLDIPITVSLTGNGPALTITSATRSTRWRMLVAPADWA